SFPSGQRIAPRPSMPPLHCSAEPFPWRTWRTTWRYAWAAPLQRFNKGYGCRNPMPERREPGLQELPYPNIASFARDLYGAQTDPEIAKKLLAALELQSGQLEQTAGIRQ